VRGDLTSTVHDREVRGRIHAAIAKDFAG